MGVSLADFVAAATFIAIDKTAFQCYNKRTKAVLMMLYVRASCALLASSSMHRTSDKTVCSPKVLVKRNNRQLWKSVGGYFLLPWLENIS